MFKAFFTYAPFLLSLGAIVLLLLKAKKWKMDWWLLLLLALLARYFVADGTFFTSLINLSETVMASIACRGSLLAILPTIIFWYKKKESGVNFPWPVYLVYLVPVVWTVVMVTLYHSVNDRSIFFQDAVYTWSETKPLLATSGPGKALYHIGQQGFVGLLIIEAIFYFAYFLKHILSLVRARPLKSHKKFLLMLAYVFMAMAVIVSLRIVVLVSFALVHPLVNAVFYIIFSVAILLSIYWDTCDKLLGMHHQRKMELMDGNSDNLDSEQLGFEKLMLVDGWCYRKGITEDMVAKELGTNRTYLSAMINNCYDTSFTAWVLEKRIKYSQQLMLEKPDAKLVEIAEKCGFADDSVFSRSFSKKVGMTPREWYTKNKD